jgi:hypothetical protein
MNQIEIWLGVLTRRVLRWGNFESREALARAITVAVAIRYFDARSEST